MTRSEMIEEMIAVIVNAPLDCSTRDVVKLILAKQEELGALFDWNHDPTPHCSWCGSMTAKDCKCKPRAEND